MSEFLSWLAVERKVAPSTENQALGAILFLYRDVLDTDLGWVDGIVRVRRPRRLPVVLDRAEVARVLSELRDTPKLVVNLLYGSDLRLLECLQFRVKDLDFDSSCLIVRKWKGRSRLGNDFSSHCD